MSYSGPQFTYERNLDLDTQGISFVNAKYVRFQLMATHFPGLIGVIVFYLVILGVGLYAAWKNSKMRKEAEEQVSAEDVILAKRNINLFVGVMTMTGE